MSTSFGQLTSLTAFLLNLVTHSQAFPSNFCAVASGPANPECRISFVYRQACESFCTGAFDKVAVSHRRRQVYPTGLSFSPCEPRRVSRQCNADATPGSHTRPVSEGSPSVLSTPSDLGRTAIKLERPKWLPSYMPSWLVKKRHPFTQFVIMLALYAFHIFYLSKNTWNFPFQLFPNDRGAFQSVGLDSVAGLLVVAVVLASRKSAGVSAIPPIFAIDSPPWRVPREARRWLGGTTGLLLLAYIASGYGAVFFEQVLLLLSVYDVPLTIPTMRAWKVLLGHLLWVFMGVKILGKQLKPFFPPDGTWLRWRTDSNWVWWVTGSYYLSALLFNMADLANQLILPSAVFDEESVVSKLINPENKDLVAMAVGAVGPCISAPVFEEVLYRGFLLPALSVTMPVKLALPVSAVLFSVHHLNLGGVIPLSILGFAWAAIYSQSRNLLVTILVHALWNSRVFLGSFHSLFIG